MCSICSRLQDGHRVDSTPSMQVGGKLANTANGKERKILKKAAMFFCYTKTVALVEKEGKSSCNKYSWDPISLRPHGKLCSSIYISIMTIGASL